MYRVTIFFHQKREGQDGVRGQMDTRKMNGECKKQKLNPGRFLQFKNPTSGSIFF